MVVLQTYQGPVCTFRLRLQLLLVCRKYLGFSWSTSLPSGHFVSRARSPFFGQEGRFLGSVSGGCIENAVIHEALESMRTGEPALLEFGVSNEQAWEVGLACGGSISVFVERLE